MEPAIGKLDVTIGATKKFRVYARDEFNEPVDLTGAKLWFTVKTSKAQADPGVLQLDSVTNIAQFIRADVSGYFDVKLLAADTAGLSETDSPYIFDTKIILADGSDHYPVEGQLRARLPVTQSS